LARGWEQSKLSHMLQTLFGSPLIFLAWLCAFLFSLSFHEFSHALVGTWLGDETARRMGRLTLNPMAHVDPFGLLTVVLIGFGWGKPVPFNPYNLKWPKWGPVAVAFAGPASNLLLSIVAAIAFSFTAPALGMNNLLVIFLLIFAQINIALMAFNLIPIPPLDGSKALLAVLSGPRHAALREMIEMRGPLLLLGLIIVDSALHLGIFSGLFAVAQNFVEWLVQLIGV
jgi:Zn-dependent protease